MIDTCLPLSYINLCYYKCYLYYYAFYICAIYLCNLFMLFINTIYAIINALSGFSIEHKMAWIEWIV